MRYSKNPVTCCTEEAGKSAQPSLCVSCISIGIGTKEVGEGSKLQAK